MDVHPKIEARTSTCRIIPKNGRVPDLKLLSSTIREVGDPFSVRGVEATVKGRIVRSGKGMLLVASGTGERFRLVPLTRKVQWDRDTKQVMPMTREEREAYRTLLDQWKEQSGLVQLTGPLQEAKKGGDVLLQVRLFEMPIRSATSEATPTK